MTSSAMSSTCSTRQPTILEELISTGSNVTNRAISKMIRETREALAFAARAVRRQDGRGVAGEDCIANDFAAHGRYYRGKLDRLSASLSRSAVRLTTMAKSKKKKPVRGSGFSVTLPTEPLAGAAKDKPVMAVLVMDDGKEILQYEIKVGNSISFRVGGTVAAFMERVGPAPDSDMFMDADAGNAEAVTVEYEHALAGPQKKVLRPGQRLTLAPVISRRWKMTAPNWEMIESMSPVRKMNIGTITDDDPSEKVSVRCGQPRQSDHSAASDDRSSARVVFWTTWFGSRRVTIMRSFDLRLAHQGGVSDEARTHRQDDEPGGHRPGHQSR